MNVNFRHLVIYFVATSFSLSLVSCNLFKDKCKKEKEQLEKLLKEEEKLKTDDISLNVFIENSGSIDGYVSQVNLFKTDTYALISNAVVTNPKLNYINETILPQSADPREFILDLTPSQFKKAGGNRTSTDIAAVISKATKGSPTVTTLLVSDFILSPDAAHRQRVDEYFNLQKNDIKNTIEKLIKANKNLGVVVLQGIADFKGSYWNKDESVSKLDEPRPYYVMLVGPKQQIALLLNKTKATTHYVHGYSEFTPSPINYEILATSDYKVGNFRPCKKSKLHITKVQTERRGNAFEFNVAVDFSNIPLNEKYILCKDNYKLSDKSYEIKAIKANQDRSLDYTHIITIASTTKKPRPSDLEIELLKIFPDWIKNSQDNDGISAQPGKTFGIQPLLEGIKLAYDAQKDRCDYYVKMKVFLDD